MPARVEAYPAWEADWKNMVVGRREPRVVSGQFLQMLFAMQLNCRCKANKQKKSHLELHGFAAENSSHRPTVVLCNIIWRHRFIIVVAEFAFFFLRFFCHNMTKNICLIGRT